MGLIGRREQQVAVDIGSETLRVAVVEPSREGLKLRAAASVASPEGAVAEGVVQSPEELGFALRGLLASVGIPYRGVAAAVGGPRVVVRPVRFPYAAPQRLARLVRYEAQRYVPFSPDESAIQHQVTGEGTDREGTYLEGVVAAAHKQVLDSRVAALEKAGLEPLVVDIECFAALRSLIYANSDSSIGDATVVILRIGGDFTEITLVRRGSFVLSRTVPLGGKAFTTAIAKSLHLENQEANRLKEELGVAVPRAAIDSLEEEQKPVVRAMSAPLEELGKEARRSFTYFLTQLSAEPAEANIDKVILCGGGSKLKGLDTFLKGHVTAEVVKADVFNSISVDCSAFETGYLEDLAPTMVVAMGLALTPYVQAGTYPFSFDVSHCGVVVRGGAEATPGELQ